jgi:hypothetical protein
MRLHDIELIEVGGVVDYASAFAQLAESDQQADAERRRAAVERRQKTVASANKTIRSAATSDAPAAVKAAKTATQNARKREADATFRAAVAEGMGGGQSVALVLLPRGRKAMHYDGSGRLIASTEWHGDELLTMTAGGAVITRTVIR